MHRTGATRQDIQSTILTDTLTDDSTTAQLTRTMKNILYGITTGLIRGLYWDALHDLNTNNAKIFKSYLQEHRPINTVRDVLTEQILIQIQNQLNRQLLNSQ